MDGPEAIPGTEPGGAVPEGPAALPGRKGIDEVLSVYGVDEDLTSQFYDAVFASRTDTDYYLRKLELHGGPVLELGCGTGRVAKLLAQHANVTALDSNPQRISLFKSSIEADPDLQTRIAPVVGDMRSFQLDQEYQLIVCPFRGFQHLLTAEDQERCLRCVYNHLADGGVFILDVFNPSVHFLGADNVGEEFGSHEAVVLADGRQVSLRERVVARDLFAQTQEAEEIYVVSSTEGQVTRFVDRYTTRYSFRFELEHLMRLCGLEPFLVEGDYHGTPFGENYPGELLISARKRWC